MPRKVLFIFATVCITLTLMLIGKLIGNYYDNYIDYHKLKSVRLINYLKSKHIYYESNDYEYVYNCTKYVSRIYDLDYKLVMAIEIKESELTHDAFNINSNNTYDYGLMQVNSCWKETALSPIMLSNYTGTNYASAKEILCNIKYNIFIGCYVLSDRINKYHDIFIAVCRYNGSGDKATQYGISVMQIYYDLCKQNI